MNPWFDLREAYSHAFMIRATLAAVAVALVCSVMSFFVVLRRLAFAGAGISHIAFGGVAMAILLGWPPGLGAALFGMGAAALLSRRASRRSLSEDTVIGVLFAATMAFGIVLLQFGKAGNVDLMAFLFGNILTVSWGELAFIALLSAVVLGLLAFYFPALVFTSFDEETAQICGLPVARLNFLLLMLLALTVVLSIRAVGLLLVAAMLVIPGAVAQLRCRGMRSFLVTSIVVGVACTLAGLALSYLIDKPSGAVIVLVASAVLGFNLLFRPQAE
jgi:ABC-type Mn2+/Zn2+ transport system permease subunit